MIRIHKESDEVLYPEEDIVVLKAEDLQELKRLAMLNPRHRIRICAHRSPSDRLHEMFIVHAKDCYVRPHKHIDKAESMAILEGEVDVILFNDDGSISRTISMGDLHSGKLFYYRLSEPIYHMLVIRTDFLVFHENTEGPFLREKTVFPDWSPVDNPIEVTHFTNRINALIHNDNTSSQTR
jgi:cupin fold WbuC family metalloprotein